MCSTVQAVPVAMAAPHCLQQQTRSAGSTWYRVFAAHSPAYQVRRTMSHSKAMTSGSCVGTGLQMAAAAGVIRTEGNSQSNFSGTLTDNPA